MAPRIAPRIAPSSEEKLLTVHKVRTHGNAFVFIDNRSGQFDEHRNDTAFKRHLCHPVFGFAVAGICELKAHPVHPVDMKYHLSSGEHGWDCGTGSRALLAFGKKIGLVQPGVPFHFQTYGGAKTATIEEETNTVTTTMSSACKIVRIHDHDNYLVNCSPHIHTRFVESGIETEDVVQQGKLLVRDLAAKQIPYPVLMLIQVVQPGRLQVRAYDASAHPDGELFACGTGELGAAIAYCKKHRLAGEQQMEFVWRDATTVVKLTANLVDSDGLVDGHWGSGKGDRHKDSFADVKITGPAHYMFSSHVNVNEFKITYSK